MWHWLIRKVRPRRGWLGLILLLATAICLPLSLIESKWLIGASTLISVSLLAAWLGFAWGHSPLPGWFVGLFGLLSGIEWSAIVRGQLLPSQGAIWREIGHCARWLSAGLQGRWTADLPFVALLPDVLTRSQALVERLSLWSQAGLAGTVSRDSLVLLLFAATATWWVCYFAGWQVARGRSALAAFVPAGAAILANVALTHGLGINYLRAFLGGALLLMVVDRHDHLQEAWQREGIDYSQELLTTVRLVGLGLTALVLVFALLVPYVTWQQMVDAFWRHAYEPWTSVSRRLDRLFAGRNPVPPQRSGGGRERGEGHSLGGSAIVGDDLVFYISTSDPPPPLPEEYERYLGDIPEPPKHYWRTVTYDTYTGRGWENGEVRRNERFAMELLADPTYPYTVLTQTVELRIPSGGLAPAANEPVQVNEPSTLVERRVGDLVGFATDASSYTVVSYIPAPTITELQEASADYPSEVSGRYLALPEVPRRVLDLAKELTAEAQTPYDKARAIETHLRSYDYDLEIPDPPPGQDVADYLLFMTRRGYCDYYATAMVVMLRAVGVPARYAAGYATGHYNYQRMAYAVTERDAHAWVEVYFPGYGWVEFEPTPYRTVFTRPVGGTSPVAMPMTPAPRAPPLESRPLSIVLVLIVAGLALGGVFGAALLALRGRRAFSSRRLALQLYAKMVRAADRARLGPSRGDTPLEFVARLGQALEARGSWAEGAAEEVRVIGQTYVRARYAAAPLSARDAGQALAAWERLRGKLRWLYIWRR